MTEGDWHAGDPVWSPDSARLAFGAATAPDADLNYRAPVYTVDVSGGFAQPELGGLADGSRRAGRVDAGRVRADRRRHDGRPFGHLRLLRVPLQRGADAEVIDLAGSLDRNVMPGGPGYPGGMPQLADGGHTVLFCVRDRGCTHVYAAPADGSCEPKAFLAGAGRVVSGLSVVIKHGATSAGWPPSRSPRLAATARSSSSTWCPGRRPSSPGTGRAGATPSFTS